ncbi:MAG: hypothetical protein IIB37_00500 [Gemmatimonadetes bacterium]|nr:hypothetical protein [Gemmatimonadota bacterium]
MIKARFAFFIAVVALMVATPTMGQILNVPVLALGAGDGATTIWGGYSRGLNDNSGKLDAIGAGVVRAMEQVSFGVSAGLVLSDDVTGFPSSEIAFAARAAYHVINDSDSPLNVSVQGGAGWSKPDDDPNDLTLLLFPVGIAISGSTSAGSLTLTPWIMPRVQFTRVGESGGIPSNTDTDFGGSAGVGFATEGGFGFGVAGDILIVDDGLGGNDSVFLLAGYLTYTL